MSVRLYDVRNGALEKAGGGGVQELQTVMYTFSEEESFGHLEGLRAKKTQACRLETTRSVTNPPEKRVLLLTDGVVMLRSC